MSHAILSPSAASRWLACTPSARLEQTFPDSAGDAAKEGTLAHAVAETLLRQYSGRITKEVADATLENLAKSEYYTADLLSHAMDYVTFVAELFQEASGQTKGNAILDIEKAIDLTYYVPEGFGTGDAIIIADKVLNVIDLKYGKGVPVSCVNNKQMMLYGLGALREYELMYDIETVRLTIYQPRLDNISSWEISVEVLEAWAKMELVPRARLAFDGKGNFAPGDHCRFCRVRATCKALADEQLKMAAYEFKEPVLLNDDEIADILSRASTFSTWIKSIEDYAFAQALDGKKWPGFKLVEGRSNRIYADQDRVAQVLINAGYPEDTIYTKSLLGITALEKAITKKVFDATLGSLVIKPAGKPTLVPENDKRPEWSSANSAVNDFNN